MFGAPAVGLILSVAFAAIVLGLVVVAMGSTVLGLVIVVAGLALVALFGSEARVVVLHGRAARWARVAYARLKRDAIRGGRFVAAWSKALLQVSGCSFRRRQLERRKKRLIRELGQATFAGADDRATELNQEAHAAVASIAEIELQRKRAIHQARRREASLVY